MSGRLTYFADTLLSNHIHIYILTFLCVRLVHIFFIILTVITKITFPLPVVIRNHIYQGYDFSFFSVSMISLKIKSRLKLSISSWKKKETSRLLECSPPSEQVSKSAYYVHEAPMGKWSWCCMSTGQDGSKELNLEWIGPVRCCVVRNLENNDCVIMAPHCGWQNITNTVKPLI